MDAPSDQGWSLRDLADVKKDSSGTVTMYIPFRGWRASRRRISKDPWGFSPEVRGSSSTQTFVLSKFMSRSSEEDLGVNPNLGPER